MKTKHKMLLLIPLVITSIYMNKNTVFALSSGDQQTSTNKVLNSISTSVRATDSNSFSVNVKINKKDVSTKMTTSSSGGSSVEPCYLWNSIGSVDEISTQLFYNNIANQSDADIIKNDDAERKKQQYLDVVKNLENSDMSDAEKAAMIEEIYSKQEYFGLSDAYETQHIAGIKGDTEYMWKYFKYNSGSMTEEEMEDFKQQKGYMMVQNPKAEFGENARCGSALADGSGIMFVTQKPIAGDLTSGGINSIVKNTQNNSAIQLKLTGDGGTYKAEIVYDGAKASDPNTLGMVPYKVDKIVYIWSVRFPDSEEPLSLTVPAAEVGKKIDLPPQKTTFSSKITGELNNTNLASELMAAFSTAHAGDGSNATGSSYFLEPNHRFLQDSSRAEVVAALKAEKDSVASLMSKTNDGYVFEPVAINVKNGAQLMNVSNGSITFNDIAASHDTFTLPKTMEGKYVVTVYAVVNGEYRIAVDPDGEEYSTFTYPLGFVSGVETELTSQCGQLSSKFGDFANIETNIGSNDIRKLEDEVCKEVKWVGPKAVAKISPTDDGKVTLDGSKSTGTKKITTTYDFKAQTQTECVEYNDKKDPSKCTKSITFYTGNATQNKVAETVETYPIKTYTWSKNYRVYNDTLDQYEIELKNDSSTSAIRNDGLLHKGNTFACLLVTTTAPQANTDGNGNGRIPSGVTTYEKMEYVNQIDSEKIASCDTIRVEDEDNRIKENW